MTPSWVEKRFLELASPTLSEVEDARECKAETLAWIDTELEELKARLNSLGGIERTPEGWKVANRIFSLEEFKRRLERAAGMRRLIEEYRAR
jgi:hypothetical protein